METNQKNNDFPKRENKKQIFDKRLVKEIVKSVEEGIPRREIIAKHGMTKGTLAEWMRQHRIWGERQKHFAAALKNHTAESLERALVIAIAAEHKLKGAERGDPWLGLLELIVKLTPKKPHLRNKASTF